MVQNDHPVGLAPKPVFRPNYLQQIDAFNAVIELRALWDYVIEEAFFIYSYIYTQLRLPFDTEILLICQKHKENFAVYDKLTGQWLIKPSEPTYKYCYNGKNFVDFTEAKSERKMDCTFLLVGKYTTLMQEPNLLVATARAPLLFSRFIMPYMKLIVGVPGCGKTSHIIKNHQVGSLVLTSCTEGAADIRSRMGQLTRRDASTFRHSYRTIDSYLLHKRTRYYQVWVDEALMEHPGKLFLVALFSGCKYMYMLGDPNQLGYINRVDAISLHYDKSSMFFKPTQTLNISYRCPVDVMEILFNKYDGGAYSKSNVLRSLKCKTFTSLKDVPNIVTDTKYLVFKQSEKKEMIRAGYNVSTIHEFQGKEAEHVIIVRMSYNLKEQLYESEPHILVAMSRHKKSLVYYTPVTDTLKTLMETPIKYDLEYQKSQSVLESKLVTICKSINQKSQSVLESKLVTIWKSIKTLIIERCKTWISALSWWVAGLRVSETDEHYYDDD